MKKLFKKRIKENMKHKEKDEKKEKRIERDKTDPQSKIKAYEKKRKMYRNFYISKSKDN